MNRTKRERERKRKQVARTIASTPESTANTHTTSNGQTSIPMNKASTHSTPLVIQVFYIVDFIVDFKEISSKSLLAILGPHSNF
jgi:hypothetical protein